LQIDKSLLNAGRHIAPALETLTGYCRTILPPYDSALLLPVSSYRDASTIQRSLQFYCSGTDHVLVQLNPRQVLIGPVFRSGQKPCPSCLSNRIQARSFAHHSTRLLLPAPCGPARVPTPAQRQDIFAVAASAAACLVQAIGNEQLSLSDAILEFDPENNGVRVHKLIPFPFCQCSNHNLKGHGRTSDLIVTEGSPPRTLAQRGNRSQGIAGLHMNFSRLESDLVGVVGNVDQKEIGPELHIAVGSVSVPVRSCLDPVLAEGRGITAEEARYSCLGEAAERYSCFFRGNEKRLSSTYLGLQGLAIHPNDVMLYSEIQYKYRGWDGLIADAAGGVPERFNESAEIEWTEANSLTDQGTRFVPTSYCFLGYLGQNHPEFCISDTNGCAAGSTLTEAIVRGLLELIERDACAIWWYNRITRPAINIESPRWDHGAYLELFKKRKRSVSVLDISTDLGVPVCVAISADEFGGDIKIGLGCDLDPSTTVLRAITELSQSLWAHECGQIRNRQRGSAFDYSCEEWARTVKLSDIPLGATALIDELSIEADGRKPADQALEYLVEQIKRVGLEAYFVELTREDIQVPCARAIVPGLRPFWRRLAPGRLYEAPVRMKWISQPSREEDLNPIAFVLAR
jgi:bacteriocin biosynthesis cyclodehydratase domain-containing protein